MAPLDATNGSRQLQVAIERLESRIHAIRRGGFDTTVSVDFPDDHPLGALATAINEMTEALRASRQARAAQEHELEIRIRTIDAQRAAIAELSSPVIEVWHGVLTLPIVGRLDTERASTMTSGLLETVVRAGAALVIIDVTGMNSADAEACDHLVRMARCVKLLGSECAISGMGPRVARTFVEVGSDLAELQSYPTLRAALTARVRGRVPISKRATPRRTRDEARRAP